MSFKPTSVPSKRLATSITSSSMAFTLNNIKGWDGNNLAATDFGSQAYGVFRNSENTIMELFEYDPATIANASITILRRGLKFTGDLTTEVAANKLTWVRNETIVELGTDGPQLLESFRKYIDNISIAGALDASADEKGITKLSVAPASAVNPIAVGDNDPRLDLLPTDDQKDALAGTGTPSTSNKFVTEDTFEAPRVQTVTAMAAQAVDGTKGNYFTRTLAGDETFTQSGFQAGQCFIIEVAEVHAITWFAGITWITLDGLKPTQTSKTVYGFRCTGTNTFVGMLVATT